MSLSTWKQLRPDLNSMFDFIEEYKKVFLEGAKDCEMTGPLQVHLRSDEVIVIGYGVSISTSYEQLLSKNTRWLRISTLVPIFEDSLCNEDLNTAASISSIG